MTQQLDEPLDACIPEAFVAAEPVIGARERARVDANVVYASPDTAFHEARPFECLDVLRRCRQRHLERLGEFAYRLFAFGETLQHGATGGIAERAEDQVQR